MEREKKKLKHRHSKKWYLCKEQFFSKCKHSMKFMSVFENFILESKQKTGGKATHTITDDENICDDDHSKRYLYSNLNFCKIFLPCDGI